VAVAATDSLDRIAAFSNFGAWTTLAAPGTDILTTMNHGGYGYSNGTSFAAPIAAGVAALVWTVAPQLSADDALTILGDNAEACASYLSGCRRVNAFQALRAAAASAPPAVAPEDPPSSDCDGYQPSGAER
jgi:subtilisin family serine protease